MRIHNLSGRNGRPHSIKRLLTLKVFSWSASYFANHDEPLLSCKVARAEHHTSRSGKKRSTLQPARRSAAGLRTKVLRKHVCTLDDMDRMEAIICTIDATLSEVVTEKFHTWRQTGFCQEECVKRCHGVRRAEVRPVSGLRTLLPRAV